MDSVVQPLELSEAIRLGAMLHPQAFDDYVDIQTSSPLIWCGQIVIDSYESTSTCALAAAGMAAGLGDALGSWGGDDDERQVWDVLPPAWHAFLAAERECPSCGKSWESATVIEHLNDDHRWTREKIADWVESVEKRLAARTERAQPEQGSLIVVPQPETSSQALSIFRFME